MVDFTYTKYPKWGTIDQALAREGFKLVSLLRLSPVMPYNVLNYILSITGIGFMPFTLASAISECTTAQASFPGVRAECLPASMR